MTDRRRRTESSDDTIREENPFAPPPEGTPDQPWQPRRPANGDGDGDGQSNGNGDDGASGSGNGASPEGGNGSGSGSGSGSGRKPWGSQWSSRQPGRQSGGFGRPRGESDGGSDGGPRRGLRWDPTDPMQRRARYALHSGIWALFFALFSIPQLALLLSALSLYWGISSLRARDRTAAGKRGTTDGKTEGETGTLTEGRGRGAGKGPAATAEDVAGTDRSAREGAGATGGDRSAASQLAAQVNVTPAQAAKAQATAAISGLVTAGLALAVVAATFTLQMVYSDYFTCTQDALTQTSREQCQELLPEQLRPFLEERTE